MVAGSTFKLYVPEVMPLVIEAIQDPGSSKKRLAAVKCLGQICQSAGAVMLPYGDFPQLLALLLRLLHEGTSPGSRREVMKVLGIIGALDPHMHKLNTASLSGEGKLELEGVRPLRHNAPVAAVGGSFVAGTLGAGGTAEDVAADLLPSAGLVTSSEDYYPTVAINALMRVLRDPSLASQHQNVISSLMDIFKALGAASVPYLPKVGLWGVGFRVTRGGGVLVWQGWGVARG
jgi:FKBP12-rapamycin complex-associated protein